VLDGGFDEEEVRFFSELVVGVTGQVSAPLGHSVSYVERRMRPGALRQVLDDLADALRPFDEDHVAGAEHGAERLDVVRGSLSIPAVLLDQDSDDPVS